MGQYVGGRYMPKFMGAYDVTQYYEALCVVDNGNDMYITKIPTPPATPLTDTNHWVLYGAGSSAISNLQNQIDNINDVELPLKADISSLAAVATSGSYNDLSNKPTIPAAQIQSDWTQSDNTKVDYIKNKPSLATVATSGSYNDLSNKPTIPAAQIQSNWTQSDNTKVDYIKNKPTIPVFEVITKSITTDNNGLANLNISPSSYYIVCAKSSDDSVANVLVTSNKWFVALSTWFDGARKANQLSTITCLCYKI